MDKDNNWHKLVMSLWEDIDPGVRNRFFENFIINGCLLGYQRQNEYKEKYNCNIPWAILLDPTSACNLKCTGCWAAEYGNHMNLTYEEMDNIITQGVEMGTKFAWFFTYMPVGKAAVPELMATAEQREMMYHKIREYRQTKPIFLSLIHI